MFRTSPTEPTELEAALLPLQIRLEPQVTLYGLRLRNLPSENPIFIALREKSPLSLGRTTFNRIELIPVKAQTRIQAIKHRDYLLEESLQATKT